jgi:hypothetical protein
MFISIHIFLPTVGKSSLYAEKKQADDEKFYE